MATAKATLSNFRQAPRKMRLVANLVRGKKVAEALVNLDFTTKKAAEPVRKLIESALANAKAQDIPSENLVVKNISVNAGKILYRRLPAWHGMAHPMRKRTSQITVELAEAESKALPKIKKEKENPVASSKKQVASKNTEKKAVKKTTKKPVAKKK